VPTPTIKGEGVVKAWNTFSTLELRNFVGKVWNLALNVRIT
jgi:hypothetical protein